MHRHKFLRHAAAVLVAAALLAAVVLAGLAAALPDTLYTDGPAAELFQRLRALRARIARMQGVPAYVVFTDKTLREMALTRPTDLRAFQAVSGVGASKAERYGRQFLAEIAAFEG